MLVITELVVSGTQCSVVVFRREVVYTTVKTFRLHINLTSNVIYPDDFVYNFNLSFPASKLKFNLSFPASTLGPAYNKFGYYEHPHIMSKYFFQKEMFFDLYQCLKSSVTMSTAYNEHIFMNEVARCKRDSV